MRVFVTGASGFIGSAVVRELLDTGHQVLGLARSDQAEAVLKAGGAKVQRGDLEDLDSLRQGAVDSDGVIHLAYNHDFTVSRLEVAKADRRAIEAMADTLVGTSRPFVIPSGTGLRAPGRPATEDTPPASDPTGRFATEEFLMSYVGRGLRPSVVRFPPTVHGRGDHGFIPVLINVARNKRVSAYPGDGSNRWPAVHRLDAAKLVVQALETAPAGARLHAVAEEGIPVRDIADAIGRHLHLPVTSVPKEEANSHFGFLGAFFSLDCPASSALTQELMGWHPMQPGLIADMEANYFSAIPSLRRYDQRT